MLSLGKVFVAMLLAGKTQAFLVRNHAGCPARTTVVLAAIPSEDGERFATKRRTRNRDYFPLEYSRSTAVDEGVVHTPWDTKEEAVLDGEDEDSALDEQEEPPFPLSLGAIGGESYQLLLEKSRPKKKSVSLHSTFASVTFGVLFTTFSGRFEPGFYSSGIPSLFPILGTVPDGLAHQFMLSISMLAATSVMGLFRVPRGAPLLRKRMFDVAAATCIFLAVIGCSSANGLVDRWWVDAFTIPGKLVVTGSFIYYFTANVRFVDEVVAGSGRGKETVAGWDTDGAAIMNTIILWLVSSTFAAFYPVLMVSDLDSYTQGVSQVFLDNQYEAFFLVSCLSASTVSGIGSLLTTLQQEKRITPAFGGVAACVLQLVLNVDAVESASNVVFRSGSLNQIHEYMIPIVRDSHIVEIYYAAGFLAILNGLRKKNSGITNDPVKQSIDALVINSTKGIVDVTGNDGKAALATEASQH